MLRIKTKANRLSYIYVLFSLILPILLLYPFLASNNFLGEGISQGCAEFLPKWIDKYAPWNSLNGIDGKGATKLLIFLSKIVILSFMVSLCNLVAFFIFDIANLKRITFIHPYFITLILTSILIGEQIVSNNLQINIFNMSVILLFIYVVFRMIYIKKKFCNKENADANNGK